MAETARNENMNDLSGFKNQIFKYAIIAALLFEAVSIPFFGIDKRYLYGLTLGTAVSIVNFNIMAISFSLLLKGRRSAVLAVTSYLIRLMIYGFVFYMSIQVGLTSALGTVLGFITVKIGIYYAHGFKRKKTSTTGVQKGSDAEKTDT